eukprot:2870924-Amphidinium_carterae.1
MELPFWCTVMRWPSSLLVVYVPVRSMVGCTVHSTPFSHAIRPCPTVPFTGGNPGNVMVSELPLMVPDAACQSECGQVALKEFTVWHTVTRESSKLVAYVPLTSGGW